MKPLVTLFAITGMLVILWAAAASRITAPVVDPMTPSMFTADIINRIQPGTPEIDVLETLGDPSAVSKYEGVTTGTTGKTCKWRSSDGHIVTARFLDGALAEIGSTAPED